MPVLCRRSFSDRFSRRPIRPRSCPSFSASHPSARVAQAVIAESAFTDATGAMLTALMLSRALQGTVHEGAGRPGARASLALLLAARDWGAIGLRGSLAGGEA